MSIDNKLDLELEKLETGDLILFSGKKSIFSSIIKYFTNSKWSHVGIVLKNPTYINKDFKGLYLWESGGLESEIDVEDSCHKLGVQIIDLKKKIENYEGTVVIRKLNNIANKYFRSRHKISELEYKLKVIHNTMYNKPYDANPLDLIMTLLQADPLNLDNRRLDKVFCSAFVGYVYTELGYIKKETNWSLIEPKHYSEEYCKVIADTIDIDWNKNYKDWIKIDMIDKITDCKVLFIDGYTLEKEIIIKE
jgi:hypothetical protein